MRRKDLTSEERAGLIQFLIIDSKNGKPPRGKMKAAELKFGVSRRTVCRLWAEAKQKQQQELIASLELSKRSTIRRLASGINCSKSTVGRWIDQGLIKAHTNAIKLELTAPNKLSRMRFCLEHIEYDRLLEKLQFKCMQNTIHIDEKWFYITKSSHRFYLTPAEAEPHRTCKSKKFITKVMFLCAVCRPIFGEDGSVLFDGKIGIFPLTEMVPAQRSSKNREAGTLEQKPIQSITKQVLKDCFIKKGRASTRAAAGLTTSAQAAAASRWAEGEAAIKAKWPSFASKTIFIQQDNARPHIKNDDIEFRECASADGFNINIVHQPPNSPDTNINDLGWFMAIQSLRTESVCFNVDQLVNAVVSSFNELAPMTLNFVFLSLQGCMIEIMKVKGQNCYKLPHMKKVSMLRQEILPLCLEVPTELVKDCISYLREKGEVEGIEDLEHRLGLHQATV
ncbi:uncharacterized protein LOC131018692 [Salvia miltiorrhiza]|uniref:uncharacterized protein LOC131018692 n=1 Tax=Salvia miltiorrhiza TaxID=226208 RepID=UPI0025AD0C6F|nr:uncharacterized protein LOC131018692 [Salvia miltiorrhiza]